MTNSNGLPSTSERSALLAKMKQLDEQQASDDRELCRQFDAIQAAPISPLDRELKLAEAHLVGAERSLANRDAYCQLALKVGNELAHLRNDAMVLGLQRVIEEVRRNLRTINALVDVRDNRAEEGHA